MKTPRQQGLENAKRRAKTPALLPLPKINTPSMKDYSKVSPLTLEGNKGITGLTALGSPPKLKKPRSK